MIAVQIGADCFDQTFFRRHFRLSRNFRANKRAVQFGKVVDQIFQMHRVQNVRRSAKLFSRRCNNRSSRCRRRRSHCRIRDVLIHKKHSLYVLCPDLHQTAADRLTQRSSLYRARRSTLPVDGSRQLRRGNRCDTISYVCTDRKMHTCRTNIE